MGTSERFKQRLSKLGVENNICRCNVENRLKRPKREVVLAFARNTENSQLFTAVLFIPPSFPD